MVRRFRKADSATPLVLMGCVQSDPRLRHGALREGRGGGRRRRIADRRSAAGGRRGAARAGRGARPRHRALRHADKRRGAAEDRSSMAPAAFSITSRWRASPARKRDRRRTTSRPPLPGCAQARNSRSRSASASGRRNRPATVARFADGVVVGTAIVARIFECVGNKLARAALVSNVAEFCAGLAKSVHAARDTVVEWTHELDHEFRPPTDQEPDGRTEEPTRRRISGANARAAAR